MRPKRNKSSTFLGEYTGFAEISNRNENASLVRPRFVTGTDKACDPTHTLITSGLPFAASIATEDRVVTCNSRNQQPLIMFTKQF